MTTTILVATAAVVLSTTELPVPHLPIATAIVGRATCGERAYLLTSRGELIGIQAPGRPRFEIHVSPELATKPELWGLACLGDGSMWTLETGHSLASVAPDGTIRDRVPLRLPWMAVFGVGNDLVFEALPIVAGAPVLAAVHPAAIDKMRPWPGLVGRSAPGNLPAATRNLLRCGIAALGAHPCWFIDSGAISIATAAGNHSIALPARDLAMLDREMPIRDSAVIGVASLWVLASSARADGRSHHGDIVMLVGPAGARAHVRLPRAGRLILFASRDRCTLLLEGGAFLQVTAS